MTNGRILFTSLEEPIEDAHSKIFIRLGKKVEIGLESKLLTRSQADQLTRLLKVMREFIKQENARPTKP